MKSFVRIGHRGAKALEPENTLRSFVHAREIGVDAVELDLRVSSDGHLVVIHDENVERTTDSEGLVAEMTLEELRELNAGEGEQIPVPEEVIEQCEDIKQIIFELKVPGIEEKVVELIQSKGIEHKATVISFDHNSILKIHELDPSIRTGVLMVGFPIRPAHQALAAGSELVVANHNYIHGPFVKMCHAKNVEVYCYTLNTVEDIVKAAKKGVDGIASDDPRLFIKALEELKG